MPGRDLSSVYSDLIDRLGTIERPEQGQEFLSSTAKIYGFKDVAYLSTDMPVGNTRQNYFMATYKKRWTDHYQKRDFVAIDPVVSQGMKSILPIEWDADHFKEKPVQTFFGEAGDFGVAQRGITFPILGRHGEHAFFTVMADEKPLEWEKRTKLFMRDFQVLSYHVHQMILRAEGILSKVVKLSAREKECLKWVAAGKTVAEIAIIISLSEHTVRFHLDLARNKLDTMNVTHSVAKAISLKLI